MDYHLALSLFALAAAVASLVYTVRNNRRISTLLASPEAARVVVAWNDAYPVGTSIAWEPEPFDPLKGRIAGVTSSKAYVTKDGKPVVDVERFGAINLNQCVFPI